MERINNANKLSEVSSEMAYQLPNTEVAKFKDFFYELEENK